jgi:proteic killer suppression protein
VIASFKDKGTEDVFNNEDTRAARKTCPREIWKVAQRKLAMIEAAAVLTDLRVPPGNELKKLKEDRAGQQSIRINDQSRVCFVWTAKGAEDVEITDYH